MEEEFDCDKIGIPEEVKKPYAWWRSDPAPQVDLNAAAGQPIIYFDYGSIKSIEILRRYARKKKEEEEKTLSFNDEWLD